MAENGTILAPEVPETTNNMSVQIVDSAIYRICKELSRMTSARMTTITDDDKTRCDQFYAWLLRLIETTTASISDFHYLANMPLRDLNESTALVENPALQAAQNHLVGADVNLRISPSGRANDSLTPQDKADLVEAINKSKSYINDFHANDNPLDLNQSAPDKPVVSPMQMPVAGGK
jgi:hypothetical protein